jgi:hypothetical protein
MMSVHLRPLMGAAVFAGFSTLLVTGATAQETTVVPAESSQASQSPATGDTSKSANAETPDPRAGDATYEQAAKLLRAIDAILETTAENRAEAKKLPSKDDFLIPPVFSETRESREAKIRDLLDSALGIVTDVPVVDLQKTLEDNRKAIRDGEDHIADLKKRQLSAPKEATLAGYLTDTVDSLQRESDEQLKKNDDARATIAATKAKIGEALGKQGIKMSPDQLDLLLDSVLSGDLVRLVAVFNSAKLIDEQLGKGIQGNGDNLGSARKFFAMHAALFAMLVHAQDSLIDKIDTVYMPRLQAIAKDIVAARNDTKKLLGGQNRDDQTKALEANLKSQDFAEKVANYYRGYLLQQREQLAQARLKAAKDLKIADNTYETVEASFQLKQLIKDASASFEAIQKLETPGFDQIFQNQELRQEFDNLTRKLDAPTS